ncbi:GLPGLI family protein [Mucilaginibacter aquaedulcis]|uniref:GLPGLI family protein n=1 Tax=Mucilaginibacter aquaedulcis TaxID=1187081 RepID=UPI0025B3541B|nr:GLPGLI family protein [Mucilaginibacter aquaedulcis]MDN3548812.1 GLPGLI family protein [Mucilaginibacter aquaedulcis]
MKKIARMAVLILLTAANYSFGQTSEIIDHGLIEYEKQVNNFPQLKNILLNNGDFDQYVRRNPQFEIFTFNLHFSGDRSLYISGREKETENIISKLTANNSFYMDLRQRSYTGYKEVFEQSFIVKDTIRPIKWKITNEKRDILGFECRRANAVILDSVFVVAFYTTQISTCGGPESFNGLPGMILQVSLPHEHISWVARRVSQTVDKNLIQAPHKGMIVNYDLYKKKLSDVLQPMGRPGQLILKDLLL